MTEATQTKEFKEKFDACRELTIDDVWDFTEDIELKLYKEREELLEQARLLGKSGSREAKLLANLEDVKRDLARAQSLSASLAHEKSQWRECADRLVKLVNAEASIEAKLAVEEYLNLDKETHI